MKPHPLILVLAAALAAQQRGVVPAAGTTQPETQPPAAAAETKPEDRCAIEGQVFSVATGEPVKRATVILRRTDLSPSAGSIPTSYTTATDADGSFAMKDIDPGKYRLSVNRAGFVTGEYGSRGPLRPGATLSLAPGQRLQGVVFRLTPHAVITGRVIDEEGEAMVGVQMQVMRYRYIQGRKQLVPMGGSTTNDLGEYRIFGVAPGRCYVSAAYRDGTLFEPTVDRSANQQPEEGYVTTYYPGTIDPSTAVPLDVAAGGQIQSIDFKLSKTRTVHIRGRVMGPSGQLRRQAMISLMPRDRMALSMYRPISTDSNGRFEIRGVAPGSYNLVASFNDGDRYLSVRQAVEAGNSHIDNLTVAIRAGIELNGKIRTEGDAAANIADLRVSLRPRDSNGMIFGPTPSGRVKEGGAFTLSNVSADHFNFAFFNLPDGFYVKSIRAGDDDVLAHGLDLTGGAGGNIDIVLSPSAGQVEGAVQNDKQQPAVGATVVMAPQEKDRSDQISYYKMVTTDQYGHFTIKSVDPGEYKVYAWEDLESGAYMDPDFVKPVESKAKSLVIRENSRESLQLNIIPAEAVPANDTGRTTPNN